MNPYNVLIRPLLSEKSNTTRESTGKYTFEVRLDATKEDIAAAVTKLYDVKPLSVRTNITRGKFRRRGIHVSLTSKKKKAVITLPEGAKIPGLFEE